MNSKELITAWILCLLGGYILIMLFYTEHKHNKEIENLNKQIELLECYKENYLIMADSLDGIHNSCFRIGK